MIGIELRQCEACIIAFVRSECIGIRLAGNLEGLAHRDAGDVSQLLGLREGVRDHEVIRPLLDLDKLNDLVELAFLMLLRLGVHVRRADSDERRAAVADFLALFVELLAEDSASSWMYHSDTDLR